MRSTKPSRLGDKFDRRNDLTIKIEGKQGRRAERSFRRHDHSHLSIHERYSSDMGSTRVRERVGGNGSCTADHRRLARRHQRRIQRKTRRDSGYRTADSLIASAARAAIPAEVRSKAPSATARPRTSGVHDRGVGCRSETSVVSPRPSLRGSDAATRVPSSRTATA